MPYPLEKLAYGLRRRLRELTTRSEAYAFQIAAPNLAGLQPIQKVQILSKARFLIDENNELQKDFSPQYSAQTDSQELPLYIVSDELAFENFTLNDKMTPLLDDLQLIPKRVYFTDCILDNEFIQRFVNSIHDPIKNIDFYPCTLPSENAAKLLLNSPAFGALEEFTVMEPAFPSVSWWIDAFVETKCTSLKLFSADEAMLTTFNINPDNFLKFFKAQCDEFKMYFGIAEESDKPLTLELLKNLLNTHFEGDDPDKDKFVCLHFGDEDDDSFFTLRAEYDV
uniref:F-box domain-containing protein n=1 Tax=Panagrellus redivivus TaxID=6233 RepID=A0A7E4VAD9_PANRE